MIARPLSTRRSLPRIVVAGAVALATLSLTAPGSRQARAAADPIPGIVGAQTGVRTVANSSADLPNADLLGNGDALVSTYGNPDSLSFNVAKTDFWKDRSLDSTGAYTNPMPLRVGSVVVRIPALSGGTYRQEQDLYNAEVRSIFTAGSVSLTERSRVLATSNNLLVTDLQNTSATAVSVTVDTIANSSFATSGATTTAGTANADTAWAARTGPTGQGWGPTGNAFQMRASMSTRIMGATASLSSNGTTTASSAFTVPANTTVSVVTEIASTGGTALTNAPGDPSTTSNADVHALAAQDVTDLGTAHRTWWSNFWHVSSVNLTAEPTLMRYYYGSLYVLASSNRTGHFAPGLNGWNGTDTPNWQSDYTTNYNVQAPYYGVYSSNHPELAQSYYKTIVGISQQQGEAYAASRGFQGTHFMTHYGPLGITSERTNGDFGQKTDALESAINFLNDYSYTRDTTTLSTTSYPFLIKVADFWDNYLVKDANGRYVVNSSDVAEADSSHAFNPTTALAYLRTFYQGILSASQDLGLDSARRAKWQDILTNLAQYTTVSYGGKTVFSFSEDNPTATANNYPYNLYPAFPSSQVGLSSPLAATARNTIATRSSYWAQGNSFPEDLPRRSACRLSGPAGGDADERHPQAPPGRERLLQAGRWRTGDCRRHRGDRQHAVAEHGRSAAGVCELDGDRRELLQPAGGRCLHGVQSAHRRRGTERHHHQ